MNKLANVFKITSNSIKIHLFHNIFLEFQRIYGKTYTFLIWIILYSITHQMHFRTKLKTIIILS